MSLSTQDFVIDDSNFRQLVNGQVVNGRMMTTGAIPRNFNTHPTGYLAVAPAFSVAMEVIERPQWPSLIKELEDTKSRLSDVRMRGNYGQMILSMDQGQYGYCWGHSSTFANMLLRALMNLPYVPLSAFAVCATIKNGQNEGGWGAQSLEFLTIKGQPSQKFWPQHDVDLSLGTAECWANAALHKVTEGWVDMDAAQYDRDLTFDQVMTCLLLRIPVIGDFNWWGHSICLMDPIEVNPSLDLTDINRWGIRFNNSWTDQWGDRGMGVLKGQKAVPDGATAPRVTMASAA